MTEKTVCLYIETSIRGPRRGPGAYVYLLETEIPGGPWRKSGEGQQEEGTENSLTLKALEEALGRFKKPCRVELYLDCRYVAMALEKGWMEAWREKGWMTSKGKPVQDAERWMRIRELLEAHELKVHLEEQHSYKRWMQWTLQGGKDGRTV